MNTIMFCGTQKAYQFIFFEYLCARLRVRKQIEQNCLDGLAFAMVYLRAKELDAAVLHMLF